jgi:hypothetical protein
MPQAIEKQLNDAIGLLNTKQKKAVLGIVKALADEEPVYDHWKDENFVKEMENRYHDYKSGKSGLVMLEEVEKKHGTPLKSSRLKKQANEWGDSRTS